MAPDVDEVHLKSQSEIAHDVLLSLQSICLIEYAQWIREDPEDHEYRVISALLPAGTEGYSTAHRNGIIGQVFRAQASILATHVRNHPLYDTFDDSIAWELCFPLFLNGNLEAVINLEGAGELSADQDLWEKISRAVEQTAGYHLPALLPKDGSCHFVKTRQLLIRAPFQDIDGVIELAQSTASGGRNTLLVGDYPHLVRGRGPSVSEAIQQGLGMSYCFFGVEKRLDLLATGPNPGEVLRTHPNWWHLCEGRYELVLVNSE